MTETFNIAVTQPIDKNFDLFSTKGKFEYLPKWLNLIPMVAQWLWLSLRYRSISLPSSANPCITAGGMVGDGKLEYFASMGHLAKSFTAPFISLKASQEFSLENALEQMCLDKLEFPVVAKPNLSWCGYGVRLLQTPEDITDYAENYPVGETFLLQKFIPDEGEAGIFYVRFPHEAQGKIIGILLRFFPKVVGDGKRTVRELVEANIRLKRLTHNTLHQANYDPEYLPKAGETVRLALIGSTRVGGLYLDGTEHVTSALTEKLNLIARDMKEFYLGRFDARYKTLEDLKSGNFTIMEVNGAGSEAVHAWDPAYTISEVYKIVFAKQKILFSLAHENRKRGHKPIGFFKLAQLHFHQQRLMRHYPLSN